MFVNNVYRHQKCNIMKKLLILSVVFLAFAAQAQQVPDSVYLERLQVMSDADQNARRMLDSELDKARRYYGKATTNERLTLHEEILNKEEEQLQLQASIRQLERLIRQTEQSSY